MVITLDVVPTDPDDHRLLEGAVAGRAHVIVSGYRDLRRLSTYDGIAIVSPRDFMRWDRVRAWIASAAPSTSEERSEGGA